MAENFDQFLERVKQDELSDAEKLSPREYVQLRRKLYPKLSPQLVYYYIRNGKLKDETCICGRRVIDVAEADAFFEERWGRD
jgi:hypothetical protein